MKRVKARRLDKQDANLFDGLNDALSSCNGAPLVRFYFSFVSMRHHHSTCTSDRCDPMSRASEKEVAMLSHLPCPFIGCGLRSPKSSRCRRRWRIRRTAWLLCELSIASPSYFALGCPKRQSDVKQRMGSYRVSDAQLSCASRLFEEALALARTDPLFSQGPGRGANRMHDLLQEFAACNDGVSKSLTLRALQLFQWIQAGSRSLRWLAL